MITIDGAELSPDGPELDPFDLLALKEAYAEHMAVAEHETIQLQDDVHSDQYYATEHEVDVLCERLGIDYSDDIENLQEIIGNEIDSGMGD